MSEWKNRVWSSRNRRTLAAAALLALGAAGGAGAVQMTRPSVEMAPTVPTAVARLSQASGIVTVKGRVAEVYGDRFVLQDGSGRTLVDVGPAGEGVQSGSMLTVQGRYVDGQLHASYLVDGAGQVQAVGAPPPHRRGGPGTPPPPPPAGPNAPPPPPPPPGIVPPMPASVPPPAAAAPVAGPAAAAVPPAPSPGATPTR